MYLFLKFFLMASDNTIRIKGGRFGERHALLASKMQTRNPYVSGVGLILSRKCLALATVFVASGLAAPADRVVTASDPGRQSVAAHAVSDDYRIGAGDVLQVTVWKEPDASVGAAIVRPDGKITVPLLKEVEVAGLTPRAAERVITERLSTLIRDPDVTVVVTGINSKKAYVFGAVRKEGPITLNSQMTVLQVLSEAGGLTEFAKRKNIYVLRMNNGAPHKFPFNYDSVIKGKSLSDNIPVIPGDTIVVPQ